ncbi:unnamed protein product [Soboliphyme baturini]|uniref:DNK domain-containing protein n=1 Tax=Soboliphyme baturini TaxID=241478 RepID=A0A183ISY3_9BILA|nr:unnamed protein product [Soboliphyme baturini]
MEQLLMYVKATETFITAELRLSKPEQVNDAVWSKFCTIISYGNMSENRRLILVDDNMYYRSMRQEYYGLCRKYSIRFGQIFIACSTDEAILRNRVRQHGESVPDSVIKDMALRIEIPNSTFRVDQVTLMLSSVGEMEEKINSHDLSVEEDVGLIGLVVFLDVHVKSACAM